jgi:hypothetical protein
MTTELTDEDIEKVNITLKTLQEDMQSIINSISDENYEEAMETLQEALTHTECTICKDKFTIIGADIVKTKMLCKIGDDECRPQQKKSIQFAEKVKDTFLPIATEKNIANQRSVSEGNGLVYTKENGYKHRENIDDITINPFTAPLLLLDDLTHELSK